MLDGFFSRITEARPDPQAPGSFSACELIAQSWRRLGVRPGDVIFLSLPNGTELLKQFFGALLAGAVPALVAPLMPAARLREMSEAMGARAIGALLLPNSDIGAERTEAIGPLQVALLPPSEQPAAEAGEVVLLTSGTSGFASGCVFDFESLLLNAQHHADSIGQRGDDDVVLVCLPLHFSFALVAQAMACLVRGSRMIISGPPFDPARYLRTLRDHGVTVSSLTPVLVRSLLVQGPAAFPQSLRVLTVGGDCLPPDLVAELLARRPGKELYITYGLTQAGPRVSTLAAHAEPLRRYASVGLPLAGTKVFLSDAGLPQGVKQLCVSSRTVMKRAIGTIEGRARHALMAPQTIASGDAFEVDDGGYLYYKSRLSDYINRKGEKICLAAVRRIASQLPHVISARTPIVRDDDGTEDFDLELRVDGQFDTAAAASNTPGHGPHELFRGLLRRAEMPRHVRIVKAAAHADQLCGPSYK
jgi:acyl-CoA synthetase (AMP-forming)/AMP-acid ligase II